MQRSSYTGENREHSQPYPPCAGLTVPQPTVEHEELSISAEHAKAAGIIRGTDKEPLAWALEGGWARG